MGQWGPIEKRLEEGYIPVPIAGCHIWIKSGVPNGYGVINYRGRQQYAHRVAWMLRHGDIPKGLLVCHRCDTPSCVNVEHMFLGTHTDNMRDMVAKGREGKDTAHFGDANPTRKNPEIVRGENNGRAKLTWEKVRQIRQRFSDGATRQELATEYQMSRCHINGILRNTSWVI